MDASNYFQDRRMLDAAAAIDRQDAHALRTMVRAGLDLNQPGRDGFTLLIYALGNKRLEAAAELLRLGADPNQRTPEGISALFLAAGSPDDSLLKILLDGGGNPNLTGERDKPISFTAARQQRWENLDLLFSKGARLDATDPGGHTILHELALFNQFHKILELVERGADPLRPDSLGWNIAHHVQVARVDPKSPAGAGLARLEALLRSRGVRFPVTLPGAKSR